MSDTPFPSDYKVKHVTNITDKTFRHSFNGYPVILEAGEKQAFPGPMADLLAEHIAKRIMRGEFLAKKKKTDQGKWYHPNRRHELMPLILTDSGEEVHKPKPSTAEKIRQEVEDVNKRFAPEEKPEDVAKEAKEELKKGVQPLDGVSKKELQEQLDSLGVQYQKTMNKSELKGLLEAYGQGPQEPKPDEPQPEEPLTDPEE